MWRRLSFGLFGLAFAGLAVAFGIACGGSSEKNDDITSPLGDGGPGSSGSSGTGTATGSSSGTSGAGAGGGTSGGTSGAPGPSGGPTDGGINPHDAGPGGTTTTLACGTATCAIPDQSCCVQQTGGATVYSCSAANTACPGATGGGGVRDVTALKCSSQANCAAGTVCCVRQVNGGVASDCQTSCTQNQAQLCDKTATATGCSVSQPCSSNQISDWGLPSSYATCGGKGN